jgi:hypothetical protein
LAAILFFDFKGRKPLLKTPNHTTFDKLIKIAINLIVVARPTAQTHDYPPGHAFALNHLSPPAASLATVAVNNETLH